MKIVRRVPASHNLSQAEVWELLEQCEDKDALDDFQTQGESLSKEGTEQIKAIEGKATSFAAYGAAVVTLLVSTYALWSSVGNGWSKVVVCFAAMSGFLCESFSVRALALAPAKRISDKNWLRTAESVTQLKRLRILTLWSLIDARRPVYDRKVNYLLCAQTWLSGAVACLVVLLAQFAVLKFGLGLVAPSHCVVEKEFWDALYKLANILRSWGCVAAAGGCFLFFSWRTFRIFARVSFGHRLVSVRNRIRARIAPKL